jgi:hypothetical protein
VEVRMFGIFDAHGDLIEGGFFEKGAAEDVLWSEYLRTTVGAYVARQ